MNLENSEVSAPIPQLTAPITLYVSVESGNDFATAPRWAKIEMTQGKLEKLHALAQVVRENELHSATQVDYVAEWSTDAEEELRIDGEYLEVSGDSFWHTGSPKHGDYRFETRLIEIRELLQVLQGAEHADHEFCERQGALVIWGYSSDRESLIEQLLEAGVALPGFEPPAE